MLRLTLKIFDIQLKAFVEKNKQDDHDVPNLKKHGSIIKWIKSFKIHLISVI